MTYARPIILSAILLSGCAAPSGDSRSASFSNSLGSATARDSGSRCSIQTSAPSGSALKSQQINFVVESSDGVTWTNREFPVATGASKTLGELQSLLGSALRRGLTAANGTELAKVGDINYGGEVRLIARGGGVVDFAYQPALEHGNPRLSAGEAAVFERLLSK